MEPASIAKGTCYALFAFEVGLSIDLEACERLIPAMGRQTLRHTRRAPQYFQYRPAPLRMSQDTDPVTIGRFVTHPQVEIVLYDFGALLVAFALPIQGPLDQLVPLSCDLVGHAELQRLARQHATALVAAARSAVVRPDVADTVEDYVVYHVESLAGSTPAPALLQTHGQVLAQILRSERQVLSGQEMADALAATLSFGEQDVTIVDWNAALVFDPDGDEIRAVFEFANVQLLEMRFLDEQLDDALEHAYQVLAARSWRRGWLTRAFGADLEHLSTLQADGAVLFERVTNALKLIGDMYLSRLYRMVSQRFRLSEWDSGITRKLQTIDGIYQKLSDRASARRLEALEWIVILLIALEIVLPFLGH